MFASQSFHFLSTVDGDGDDGGELMIIIETGETRRVCVCVCAYVLVSGQRTHTQAPGEESRELHDATEHRKEINCQRRGGEKDKKYLHNPATVVRF